jgi:hypothetical protein
MPSHGEFSVSTAVILLLGAIAAMILATTIALRGSGSNRHLVPIAPESAALPQPSQGASRGATTAPPEREIPIEYPLDTSEPTPSQEGR